MAAHSKIEWTDHTFNPWIGCTKVSPGCLHCYAERRDIRLAGGHWGKGAPRQHTSAANWRQPLTWNKTKQCANCGASTPWNSLTCEVLGCAHFEFRRPRVFCASLADWLDDEVPVEWLVELLDLIRRTPNLDWLLLTKRPENWRPRIEAAQVGAADDLRAFAYDWLYADTPPDNVWIGTTVEDQKRANERIPHVLCILAKVRFLSCEPLLGPLELRGMRVNDDPLFRYWPLTGEMMDDGMNEPRFHPTNERIHWVICGGESGPGARPMHPDWARSLRDQCAAAKVPFLFKQWGEWLGVGPSDLHPGCKFDSGKKWLDGETAAFRVGKTAAGRLLDGREHNEFPKPREAAPSR